MVAESDLTKVAPPTKLSSAERLHIFEHIRSRLNEHCGKALFFAQKERDLSSKSSGQGSREVQDAQTREIEKWATELLHNIWAACQEPNGENCPSLVSGLLVADPSAPPDQAQLNRLLNTVLFLHLTATKGYHAHTRVFLCCLGSFDEDVITATLKDPERAVLEAEAKTQDAKENHARQNRTLRRVGIGLAAVGGGILVGVTGGLAAPLVGSGVVTVLSWLGVGGTAAGMLAGGLAGSSVVCGALFGAYGSRKSAQMVGRYTKEVRDLSIVPVRPPTETLAVRLCVSGWLDTPEDVTEPWTVFSERDTFALQWEVDALMKLSGALNTLIKSQAMQYVGGKVVQQTVFAALMSALSPAAWINIGHIIDNPWMTAKALAYKAGKVLGVLIEQRVLGNRPISLIGYSLGSLVIFAALRHLASLPPSDSACLIEDVFLFGAPVPVQASQWASARRVVAGRLVNGYSKRDYVLAVLARLSEGAWGVAGLQPVNVDGVENIECSEVDGHLRWKGLLGRELLRCGAPGVEEALVKHDVSDDEAGRVKDTARSPVTSEGDIFVREEDEGRPQSPSRRSGLPSLRSSSSQDSQNRTLSSRRTA